MIYLLTISFIILAISWKKSKSKFFEQSREALLEKCQLLELVLKDRNVSKKTRNEILDIYDIFKNYPTIYKFDGATIVKDLNDLPNLDLDAMYHDFQYIFEGANRNFIKKFKSDLKYIKNMEKNGKGIRVTRFILLTLSGIIFVPYSIIKNELFRKI